MKPLRFAPLHVVIVTLLAGVAVAPAQATSLQHEPRSKVVSYADLDLTQDAGVRKLYVRIRLAARSVCWTEGVAAIVKGADMRACAADATTRAVADMKTPSLTRYHAERTGNDDVAQGDSQGDSAAYRSNVPGTVIVAAR